MAVIEVLKSTATWLPFVATDVGDGAPRTGVTYGQVQVEYKKYGQTSFSIKTLLVTDFQEIGSGVYEILFSSGELDTEGAFMYVVNSTGALPSPALRQYIGQADVETASSYTPGAITLSTNILTGNLIDLNGNALSGESVSARILSAPTVMGTTPNIGGVGTDMVSVLTDTAGFFALEVLQGSEIDVVIPVINYRRTLTVPANSTDKLFELA